MVTKLKPPYDVVNLAAPGASGTIDEFFAKNSAMLRDEERRIRLEITLATQLKEQAPVCPFFLVSEWPILIK